MKIAIINDTRNENHYGCLSVMRNLLELIHNHGGIVAWTWPVHVDWREHIPEILELPSVDFIIVNGEGTIHHSDERTQAHALAEFAEFAKKQWNIPSYLINATFQANQPKVYKHIKAYQLVYARDKGSLVELQNNNIDAQHAPDLTFHQSFRLNKQNSSAPRAMIGSVSRSVSKKMANFVKPLHFREISIIHYKPKRSKTLKIPLMSLKKIIKWAKFKNKQGCPKEFIKLMKESNFVLTGRYHAVTLCIENEIPFYAVGSNTSKIEYLLTDVFGHSERVIHVDQLDHKKMEEFYEYNEQELAQIKSFTKNAKLEINNMITNIFNDAAQSTNNKH